MRFALQDQLLVPDSSLSKDSDSKPITYIDHFPQPPLNPDFPFNGELQNLLAGKQLLLSDLPFSIDLIQAHYENGYLQYRKSIAIENHQPYLHSLRESRTPSFCFFSMCQLSGRMYVLPQLYHDGKNEHLYAINKLDGTDSCN